MTEQFEVIILTSSGDFLLQEEAQLHREEKGVELEQPHVINEEEKAHPVQATEIFIPYSSVENIQYGQFEHEIAE